MTVKISHAQARKLGIVPKGDKQKREPSILEEGFASLWGRLGNGIAPVRQFKFLPARRYTADFAWPEHRLIVEIDGGEWIHGRHSRARAAECERDRMTVLAGWRVLRYVGSDLKRRPVQITEEIKLILERDLPCCDSGGS